MDAMIDLEKISESPHLLDVLIQMEDVLDSLDVYVFENWYLGEIVEGPKIRRYWYDMTIKYPLEKKPDPRAALRLMKHRCRVDYWKARYGEDSEFVDHKDDDDIATANEVAMGEQPSDQDEVFWLVRISIPRILVSQMSAEEHDFYDDEIDVDDIEDAKDSGIDSESAFTDGGLADEDSSTGMDMGDVDAEKGDKF